MFTFTLFYFSMFFISFQHQPVKAHEHLSRPQLKDASLQMSPGVCSGDQLVFSVIASGWYLLFYKLKLTQLIDC